MSVHELLLVGGGRMGSALLGGLLAGGGLTPNQCAVLERDERLRSELVERFPGVTVSGQATPANAAVLAVKPYDAAAGCAALEGSGASRVLSILAGTMLSTLEGLLPEGTAVVRAMPNTPALLGAGATAVAPGSTASDADVEWAETILSPLGLVVRMPEKLLDAVTGLSGSGPAYVFLFAEALIEAGVTAGLDRQSSKELALQTILGAARMLTETGESPENLRAQVTSPGGTTAAGLLALERAGIRAAIAEAVLDAAERSRELGLS